MSSKDFESFPKDWLWDYGYGDLLHIEVGPPHLPIDSSVFRSYPTRHRMMLFEALPVTGMFHVNDVP